MELKLLIGIDDTDNLESRGTGSIAEEMRQIIEENKWGVCGFITRHQLYLHPDIAYTSHNSSMIFDAVILEEYYEKLKNTLGLYLEQESAEGSDPGLCIAVVDRIPDKKRLVEFGYRAKEQVLTKEQAYTLAEEEGVFLVEKGGLGIGIIGALAGIGLRLDGNDGEIKGGIGQYVPGEKVMVQELLQNKKISKVLNLDDFSEISDNEWVSVVWKIKPMLHCGEPVVFVKKDPEKRQWISLAKEEMRSFGDRRSSISPCTFFKEDVAEEEVYAEKESCFNCAFRRWTADSFTCEHKAKR